ncbi:L-rhamnose-binding lectin CSL3-like [Glandiceps talaboti]
MAWTTWPQIAVFACFFIGTCSGIVLEEPDCPPGLPFVNCTVSPCDVEAAVCTADPGAECRPDYCGGCVAKFYDKDGGKEVHCELDVGIICENKNTTLHCPDNSHVMTVVSAMYGRQSAEVCVHPYGQEKLHNNTNCSAGNATEIITELCDGQYSCHPVVNNAVFGDPCYGTYKYLEVDFTCAVPGASKAMVLSGARTVAMVSVVWMYLQAYSGV